ncbi:hypothetical protein FOZ62_021069, partial [Perkinsus olseni]
KEKGHRQRKTRGQSGAIGGRGADDGAAVPPEAPAAADIQPPPPPPARPDGERPAAATPRDGGSEIARSEVSTVIHRSGKVDDDDGHHSDPQQPAKSPSGRRRPQQLAPPGVEATDTDSVKSTPARVGQQQKPRTPSEGSEEDMVTISNRAPSAPAPLQSEAGGGQQALP